MRNGWPLVRLTDADMARTAAEVNKHTLDSHLIVCRKEMNALHDDLREIKRQLGDEKTAHDKTRGVLSDAAKNLRALKTLSDVAVVEIVLQNVGGARRKYVTVASILEDESLVSHEICHLCNNPDHIPALGDERDCPEKR